MEIAMGPNHTVLLTDQGKSSQWVKIVMPNLDEDIRGRILGRGQKLSKLWAIKRLP